MPKWVAHTSGVAARNGTTSITIPTPRGASTPAGATLIAVLACAATMTINSADWYHRASQIDELEQALIVKDSAAAGEASISITTSAIDYPVSYEVFEFPAGSEIINAHMAWTNAGSITPHTMPGTEGADFFYAAETRPVVITSGTRDITWASGTELSDLYPLRASGTDAASLSSVYFEDLAVTSWTPPTNTATGNSGAGYFYHVYFAVSSVGITPAPKWVKRTKGILPRNGTNTHVIPTPSGAATPAGSFLMLTLAGAVTNTISASGWVEQQQPVSATELSLFTRASASAGEASVTVTHNGSNYPIAFEFFEFMPGTAYVNSSNAVNTTAWSALTGLSTADFFYCALDRGVGGTGNARGRQDTEFETPIKKSFNANTRKTSTDGIYFASGYAENLGISSWTPNSTTTIDTTYAGTDGEMHVWAALNVVEPADTGNSRTATFSGSGTASATVTSSETGDGTVNHNIYGASTIPDTPGALTTGNDGQGISIATAFYTLGVTGWRCKGARLYVPSGSALIGRTVTFRAWANGVLATGLPRTSNPNGTTAPTATSGAIVVGAGWNTVSWTPFDITPATNKVSIAYTSPGEYLYIAGSTASPYNTSKQATDSSPLYMSETGGTTLTPPGRGSFRYADGTAGDFNFYSGIDIIVDEGVPAVPTRAANFSGSGTASTTVTEVEIRTAQFSGTGTGSASVVVDNIAIRTATFSGAGTASATSYKAEVRTAQFSGTGTATAVAGVRRTIAQENALTGENNNQITISGAGDTTNLGFCREFSVDAGQSAHFSCSGNGTVLDIYRIGYYGGLGWRKVETLTNTATTQPAPNTIADSNGAVTCTNWSTTATWDVPTTAVSGLYVGVLRNAALNNASYIPFVVRNDSVVADIIIKTSDTTWALAYNYFESMTNPLTGKSVYGSGGAVGGSGGITNRALATSYHKPIVTRDGINQTYWLNAEAPLIRWAERMGYNVKYVSSKDFDQIGPSVAAGAKVIVSSGHDEYWSQNMRDAFKTCRDTYGQHLLFMSGNEVFWRTRFTDENTMWCYKDTMTGPGGHVAGTALDPVTWTGTWKDTRPANAATRAPEKNITGTDFRMNGVVDIDPTFTTGVYNLHPVWRNSAYAAGTPFTASRIVGFEADFIAPETLGYSVLCAYTFNIDGRYADDNGENYSGNGNLNWGVVSQRYTSGAVVVGFGTCQWQWALDGVHDRGNTAENLNIQQFQYNLFRDLGAAPETPHSGIVTSSPQALSSYGVADVALRTAQFSGSGTASATVTPVAFRTATFNGSGTASAAVVESEVRVAQFNSEGTVSATSTSIHTANAQFNGSGQLSASVTSEGGTFNASAEFGGSGTASATALTVHSVTATFSGAGQASATTTLTNVVTADFSGSGQASATVNQGFELTATFNGNGTASATLSTVHTIQANFNGSGQVTAQQTVEIEFVQANFSGSGQASAYVPGASGSILSVGVWNGSVLRPATMTVWNGTAEVPAVKVTSV